MQELMTTRKKRAIVLSMDSATPEAKASFALALREQLRAQNLTQTEFARRVGAGESAVSNWVAGRDEPRPRSVFRIEETLGLAPGTLSRHLGYVPAETWEAPPVEAAILADPRLTGEIREAMLGLYRAWINR